MNMLILVFYVILFIGIFYFLAIRPQRKQKAQHQELVSMLKRGDEVVTIGGMYGTVKKVGTDWVDVEVAPRTTIRFMKRAISQITTVEPEAEEEYAEDEEYEDDEQGALESGEYADAAEAEAGEEYDGEEYAEEEYDEDEAEEEAVAEEDEYTSEEAPQAPEAEEAPEAQGSAKAPKSGDAK